MINTEALDGRYFLMKKEDKKILALNKDAKRAYVLLEKFEAGIVLQGTEVKSLRIGKVSLKGSYAYIQNEEIYIKDMHISPYEYGNINNHDPLRVRKLLLHKREIVRLSGKIKEKGLTMVITKLYLSSGKVKVEIALAKGKTFQDRREDIKGKEAKRDIDRAMKHDRR